MLNTHRTVRTKNAASTPQAAEKQRLPVGDVAEDELRDADSGQVAGHQGEVGQGDDQHQEGRHQQVPGPEHPSGAAEPRGQKLHGAAELALAFQVEVQGHSRHFHQDVVGQDKKDGHGSHRSHRISKVKPQIVVGQVGKPCRPDGQPENHQHRRSHGGGSDELIEQLKLEKAPAVLKKPEVLSEKAFHVPTSRSYSAAICSKGRISPAR